ncbi:MAG: hypothetical protein KFW07_00330 [Mycoplasmataceae bacterium]|nr:hypothetical protein [Mycoplasmataceae bacterium]
MKIIKEACIQSIEEAKYFINKKIDRFETCSNLLKGGLTPNIELFNYIKDNSDIHQVVMIRTNDGFEVTEEEILAMVIQIKELKKLGATEFIFGFIKNKEIDIPACEKLIDAIGDSCKYDFHMAIDSLANYERDIPILINMGFNRILTKGGENPAVQNIGSLNSIIKKYGHKIQIIIGGSVTKDNYQEIVSLTNATQVHGTKIL